MNRSLLIFSLALLLAAPLLLSSQTRRFKSIEKFMNKSSYRVDSNQVFFINKLDHKSYFPVVAGQKIRLTMNSGLNYAGFFDSISSDKIYITTKYNEVIALNPSNIRKIKTSNNLNDTRYLKSGALIFSGVLLDVFVATEISSDIFWALQWGLWGVGFDIAIGAAISTVGTTLIVKGLKFSRKSFKLSNGKWVLVTF